MKTIFAMLTLLLLCMLMQAQPGPALVQHKGRWGVKVADQWTISPKYDSLVLADSTVATGYRKGKIYYLDAAGERIYKGKVRASTHFQDGMGVVQDKKGRYEVLDRAGTRLAGPTLLLAPPVRYGKLLYLQEYYWGWDSARVSNRKLYDGIGQRLERIDTVYALGDLLVAQGEQDRRPDVRIFSQTTGKVVLRDVADIADTMGHLVIGKTDGKTALYEKETQLWVRDLDKVTVLDSTYFESVDGSVRSLYRWRDHALVVRAACKRFDFRQEVIYGVISDEAGKGWVVNVYDYEGQALKDSLTFIARMQDGRYLMQHNGLQYFGNERGDVLSPTYPRIAPIAVNGYRMVSNDSTYSYIREGSDEKLPFDLPILYKYRESTSSGGGGGGGFLETMVKLIAAPAVILTAVVLALPTGGKSFDLIGDYFGSMGGSSSTVSESRYEVLVPGPNQVFVDGMAIICRTETYPSNGVRVVYNTDALTWNYIDTTGKVLNAKHYAQCRPFQGGKAWVKEKDRWSLIDRKGKSVGSEKYELIETHDDGYTEACNSYTTTFLLFFTNTNYTCVLYDRNNHRLHKGTFSSIVKEGDVYYGLRDERRVKITTVPPAAQ